MIENLIIKLFINDYYMYLKYYKYIKLSYIKTNYTNLYKLFIIIHKYYTKVNSNEVVNKSISKADLLTEYNLNYFLEDSERDEIERLVSTILDTEITNSQSLTQLLEEHRRRALAGDIAKLALDVEEGTASTSDLIDKFADFEQQDIEKTNAVSVDMDLNNLYSSQIAESGLRWRLDWLNKSLGSLRQGDFGFVFARPETGKTTFLASEMTHMITQTEGDILWFNNEEQGKKVGVRCYQALLGLTTKQLFDDVKGNASKYEELTQNRIKIYDFEDSSHVSRIESIIKETNPSLIIFDQIDKIKGFKADRHDLQMKALYQWARELAKKYAPVIAVSQAGGTGEGKVWLTMDDVDSSKTAKQGEADWILGIGKESDNTSNARYFNISKNKLIGDKDTLPDLRHGNQAVLIQPDVARYKDIK
jgi:replicative DNA helicase